MSAENHFLASPRRIIDQYPDRTGGSGSDGPRLVVFGAVHGNEPSGVLALRQIFEQLREEDIPLAGSLTGVVGNVPALAQQVRYCDEDLNRLFLPERVEQVKSAEGDTALTVEARELREIVTLVEACEDTPAGRPFFVDCHTTSSASIPYLSLNEGFADSYHFARPIPATMVLGAEREIKGCLAEWLNRRGWHGFTLEAGQHQAASSVRHQAAVIWLALVSSGCLAEQHAAEHIRQARDTLRQQGSQQDQQYRVVSSYRIAEGEVFRMELGFVNLQPVQEGELLATSNGRPLYAPHDAHLLMPLYQKQGTFGYFLAREVGD